MPISTRVYFFLFLPLKGVEKEDLVGGGVTVAATRTKNQLTNILLVFVLLTYVPSGRVLSLCHLQRRTGTVFIFILHVRKHKDFFVELHRDAFYFSPRFSHVLFLVSVCLNLHIYIAAKNAATRALHTSRPAMQVFASKPLNAKEASVWMNMFLSHADPGRTLIPIVCTLPPDH